MMNKMRKLILLFVLLLGMGATAFAYDNTYAIIIGVADYKNFEPGNGDLTFTVSDARRFSDFLQSKRGGSVPASNIVLLTDAQATKQNILDKGKALFAKSGKNDRVIFYFSGHCGEGYFLPYDVTTFGQNLLFYDEVKSIFRTSKSNTKLLFADACHSGSMKPDAKKDVTLQKNLENGKKAASNMNIAVMLSCQQDQYSLEMGRLSQGLFTYYVMEGLGGAANRDGNKYITIQELFYYVYHHVEDMAASIGEKQTPMLFGKFNLALIVGNL